MVYVLFSDRIWQEAIFKGWERLMILWQPLENETKSVYSPNNSIQVCVCVCVCVWCAHLCVPQWHVINTESQNTVSGWYHFMLQNVITLGNKENEPCEFKDAQMCIKKKLQRLARHLSSTHMPSQESNSKSRAWSVNEDTGREKLLSLYRTARIKKNLSTQKTSFSLSEILIQ
jgi:hypothetical protein